MEIVYYFFWNDKLNKKNNIFLTQFNLGKTTNNII